MNGFEVVKEVWENPQFETLPIILLTAYTDLDLAKGLTIGANGFFSKPIDADALVGQVKVLTEDR